MPSPTYRVLYCPVLAPHDIQGELPVDSFSWDRLLNAPGAATFMMPLEASTATPLLTHQVPAAEVPPEDIGPGRTAIFVERNGDLVWGGVLWTRRYNFSEGTVELNCEGWWSYVRHRHLRVDRAYVGWDQADIAKDLVDLVRLSYTTGGDIGISTADVVDTGVLRDRAFFGFERKNLAEAVEQLAAVEDGFDWRVDTTWGPGGAPLVRFLVTYPAGGRWTDLVLELGGNVATLEVDEDAVGMANVVDALGSGEGADKLIFPVLESDASRGAYPKLEDAPVWPDVISSTTLGLHAVDELARRHRPLLAAKATMLYGAEPSIGTVDVGDILRVVAGRHVDHDFRVVGLEVRVDENGDEEVSMDLATAILFQP